MTLVGRALIVLATLAVCIAPVPAIGQERAARLTLDDALRLNARIPPCVPSASSWT